MTIKHLSPRTGEQYTIQYGDYTAIITQLGATARKLRYRGIDLLASGGADDLVTCCQGELLIPFPNRIEDGTYTFRGTTYTIPIDEPDRNNAIHGFGHNMYWNLERLSESDVTLSWRVPNLKGYPFDIVVSATYELTDEGLSLTVRAYNNGSESAPWAIAIHPWLANGLHGYGDEIDEHNAQCKLTIPAQAHVNVNDRLIPTGISSVEDTKYDFREGRMLTEQPYDDALTDIVHAQDGTVTAIFERPDGMKIRVGGDNTITSFQVCTGTGFPPEKHPAGVAVEPQTAYANAFNTGDDLIEIMPGEESVTRMFIGVMPSK